MAFDPARVTTLTFDSYGTLVDVDADERALADRVADPEPVSRLWRARSLEYTMVATHVDAYEPFYEVNRDALQYALDATGADLSTDERDEILAVYHELDVFDDVRDGLERLDGAGYDCYILSNGNPEMLDSLVEHCGIEGVVADTISAHEVELFKPHADLYRHAAERAGAPVGELAHVTALWFDVMGATHAGMQGVRVERTDAPPETFGPAPDLTVGTLDELATELDA
jgi:2-haloacid dehalogenase